MFNLNNERLQHSLTLSLVGGQVNAREKILPGHLKPCLSCRGALGIVPFGGAGGIRTLYLLTASLSLALFSVVIKAKPLFCAYRYFSLKKRVF
jgi:hypothetical protein